MDAPSPHRVRTTFRLFGFPTRIRPGFGVFLLLLLLVYPAPFGYWVALAMGAFTLIHELGHALAARRAGCNAAISLDFMVAYASYSSEKELTWRARALITIAGPAFQIGSSLVVLLAMGVNPFLRSDISQSYASAAVWWAGFALGLLNLVPLLPLDGGALVATVAEHYFPGKGRHAVLYLSFGATIGCLALLFIIDGIGLMPLVVFMLMMQWQQISQPRQMKALVENAELQATGDPRIDGAVIDALVSAGEFRRALDFGREAYTMCPAFTNAFACAQINVQLGKLEDAVQWLHAAERSQLGTNEMPRIIQSMPHLEALRDIDGASAEWFAQR